MCQKAIGVAHGWVNGFSSGPIRSNREGFVDAAARIKGEAVISDVEEHVMYYATPSGVGPNPLAGETAKSESYFPRLKLNEDSNSRRF